MPTLRLVPAGPSRRPLSRMRTAASAYRADIATRGGDDAFCENDGIWIAVGSMLSTAANLEDADRGAKIVHDALELAKEALGAERLARGNRLDPPGRSAPCNGDVVRMLAQEAEDAGALNSAALILDSYVASDHEVRPLDLGRVVAHQARLARKQGELDAALARYKDVERIGRSLNDDELRLRAWIGYGLLARHRGNFPVVQRWMRRAAETSEVLGMPMFASQAHQTLMVVAGRSGDVDTSIIHGWKALQFAKGDAIAEFDVLANLGSILLVAHHPVAAKAAYLSVLNRRMQVVQALPALGGLAMAAAQSNDFETARWAVSEVHRLAIDEAPPYQVAEALTDCAEALFTMGAASEGKAALQQAEVLSRKHGYHEYVFRIESLGSSQRSVLAAPRVLAPEAAAITRDLTDLMPSSRPDQVLVSALAS